MKVIVGSDNILTVFVGSSGCGGLHSKFTRHGTIFESMSMANKAIARLSARRKRPVISKTTHSASATPTKHSIPNARRVTRFHAASVSVRPSQPLSRMMPK